MSIYASQSGPTTVMSSWGIIDEHDDTGHVDPVVAAGHASTVDLDAYMKKVDHEADLEAVSEDMHLFDEKLGNHENVIQQTTEILQNSNDTTLAQLTVQASSLEPLQGDNKILATNLQVLEGDTPDNGVPAGLFFTKGSVSESLLMLEDARVILAPSATAAYRFGAMDGQVSNDRARYDGIDMYSGLAVEPDGSAASAQPTLNQVRIHVNDTDPTLSIRYSKEQADTRVILVRDDEDNDKLRFDAQGELWTRCTNPTASALEVFGTKEVDGSTASTVFTVKGSGQVTCGNLYARGTVDDDAVALLELVKHSGNSKFRVKQNGRRPRVCPTVPFEILNASTGNEMLEVFNTGQVRIRANNPASGEVLQIMNTANVKVFSVDETGQIYFRHNLTGGVAHMGSSVVAGSQSLYVGSTRLSYSHIEHRMLLHQLKTNHTPVYLQGRGFTTNDLPAAHTQNDMSVFKWIVHARDHFDEQELDVHDVFPTANADWDQVDAPVDGVIADVTTLQTDVSTLGAAHVGMDADITSLETEMDAAEARLDALEASSGGGTTVTFLNQAITAAATDFRGIYTSASVQTLRQLSAAETNIVVWDQYQTGPESALALPLLGGLDVGHTVLVHSLSGINLHVFQHPTDTSNGTRILWSHAWSPQIAQTGTKVQTNGSYRILKFIKTTRAPISQFNNTTQFWFVMKIDTQDS